jgi:hypothetical protein
LKFHKKNKFIVWLALFFEIYTYFKDSLLQIQGFIFLEDDGQAISPGAPDARGTTSGTRAGLDTAAHRSDAARRSATPPIAPTPGRRWTGLDGLPSAATA